MPANAIAATVLIVGVSIAHSYLGERYLFARLFRMKLPPLLRDRDDVFMKGALRFAWHLTTVAWLGLGLVLWMEPTQRVYRTVGTVFFLHAPLPIIWTGGRHRSWLFFLAIGILLWM